MTDDNGQSIIDSIADDLANYQPPEFDPTLDLFVYGQTGVGKTTLVKTLKPDCVEHDGKTMLLTNDKGNESILSAIHDTDQWLVSQPIDNFDQTRGYVRYLMTREHPFRWLVLDDCTRFAQLLNDELQTEYGDDVWGRYAALNDRFRTFLRTCRSMDINVLFLAREGEKEGEDGQKTAAFPGKALGEGNDKSSVLHEFTLAGRMTCQPVDDPDNYEHVDPEGNRYFIDFQHSDSIEAKKRDEYHVLEPKEVPDISSIRRRWVDSIQDNL